MLKNILKLDGVQKLTKEQQSKIEGGFFSTLEECQNHCTGTCVEVRMGTLGNWQTVGWGCQAIPVK